MSDMTIRIPEYSDIGVLFWNHCEINPQGLQDRLNKKINISHQYIHCEGCDIIITIHTESDIPYSNKSYIAWVLQNVCEILDESDE